MKRTLVVVERLSRRDAGDLRLFRLAPLSRAISAINSASSQRASCHWPSLPDKN